MKGLTLSAICRARRKKTRPESGNSNAAAGSGGRGNFPAKKFQPQIE